MSDPGGARRWSQMWEDVARQRAELTRVHERLAELTASATSSDGGVAVTVNARGLLVDLRIDPAAVRRHRAEVLAGLIVELTAAADEQLHTMRNQIVAATVQVSDDDPGAFVADGMSPGYRDVGSDEQGRR